MVTVTREVGLDKRYDYFNSCIGYLVEKYIQYGRFTASDLWLIEKKYKQKIEKCFKYFKMLKPILKEVRSRFSKVNFLPNYQISNGAKVDLYEPKSRTIVEIKYTSHSIEELMKSKYFRKYVKQLNLYHRIINANVYLLIISGKEKKYKLYRWF